MTDFQNSKKALDSIRNLLGQNEIKEGSIEKIISVLKPLKINKGNVFSAMGKKTDKLGILVEGLLMAKYEMSDSEKEIISRFYYLPKNVIVASFHSGTKSDESIVALEDSYLLTISREDLYNLYDQVPEMNKVGRQMAEQSYILALQRIHQLQAMTVKERLDDFYRCHPQLGNRIKVQHLCSYIGTNRNSLAKLTVKMKK